MPELSTCHASVPEDSKQNTITSAPRVAFHTLGCRVNRAETEALSACLRALGFEIALSSEKADIYVINSCTVTSIADRKSRQYVRRAKKKSPDALVALIGCYVSVAEDELKDMPEIDIMLSSEDKMKLPELLAGRFLSADHKAHASAQTGQDTRSDHIPAPKRHKAFIKIEDGCDIGCAYCIIPHARGRVLRRPYEEIMEEARTLAAEGYEELVVTGINIALYDDPPLIKLLKDIADIPGDFTLSIGSLEPTVIDEAAARELVTIPKLSHSVHLSLQSGSDSVLRRMGRRYTAADYERIVNVFRSADPDWAVTTDVIVGFPGESEREFEETMEYCRKMGFAHIHVFKYSKRPGTPAASMDDQVPEEVKNQRSERLRSISG